MSSFHLNPRQLAVQISIQTLKGQELQAVLDSSLSRFNLQPRDKALVTELCYGYFRYKGQLDFIWQSFLRKNKELPLKVVVVLGLACYELFYLSKIPAYATLSWSVDLVKKQYGQRLGGLVNAILRSCQGLELEDDLFRQDGPNLDLFWARKYSAPLWLVRYLLQRYSAQDVESFLQASLKQPRTGILFFQPLTWPEQLKSAIHFQLKNLGVVIKKGREEVVFAFLEHTKIPYYIQSIDSQKILLEVWDPDIDWIWDGCAGSGGKTFVLQRLRVKTISSDLNKKRLLFLAQKSKEFNLRLPLFRANVFYPPLQKAKNILLDVPCSGLGVLARCPDSKWKKSLKDVQTLSQIQARMLEVCQILPSGGRLLYLTCTITWEENQKQIESFLKKYPQFKLEKIIEPDFKQGQEFFFGVRLRKN